jgi:deazaflavin-dependent oxidoreductase (nitroreductase family)
MRTVATVADRPVKRRYEILLGRYTLNPLIRGIFKLGLTPPRTALVETIGRRSHQPRVVPVNYVRDGQTIWLIAQHGEHAAWVRNFQAHPRIRVRLGRTWHTATATLRSEDDVRARIRTFARGPVGQAMFIASFRALESHPVSVEVMLD